MRPVHGSTRFGALGQRGGRLAVLMAVLATAVMLSPVTAARAGAIGLPTIDVACPISFEFDFFPALNGGTSAARTTAALTACVSPNGKHPELDSSVLFADQANATAHGCAPLPLVVKGTANILWNTGATSVLSFRISTNLAAGLALGGYITGGPLKGDDILALPLVLTQDGFCGTLGGGVKSLTVNFGVDVFYHS